jgi:outer membrane lipoprotein SlyB
VGRSTSASTPAPLAEAPATAQPAEPAPQRVARVDASRDHPREASPAPAAEERQAALCQSCGRVTDVHTEKREGKSSGVGAVGGAVVGGLLGNMVGGGTGKKLATVGGAVAGGYAGNEIEKNQKSHTVWVIKVEERDGRTRRFERSADPGLRVGDEVRLSENGFTRT